MAALHVLAFYGKTHKTKAFSMVGGGSGGGTGTLVEVAVAFLAYAFLNLFLNFFNKWALSSDGGGFTLPVFYSTWHMLMSIVGSYILMMVKPPPTGMPSFEQFKTYQWEALGLSLCSTVNISCNNASLMFIGLFVNQARPVFAPPPANGGAAAATRRTCAGHQGSVAAPCHALLLHYSEEDVRSPRPTASCASVPLLRGRRGPI